MHRRQTTAIRTLTVLLTAVLGFGATGCDTAAKVIFTEAGLDVIDHTTDAVVYGVVDAILTPTSITSNQVDPRVVDAIADEVQDRLDD